ITDLSTSTTLPFFLCSSLSESDLIPSCIQHTPPCNQQWEYPLDVPVEVQLPQYQQQVMQLNNHPHPLENVETHSNPTTSPLRRHQHHHLPSNLRHPLPPTTKMKMTARQK